MRTKHLHDETFVPGLEDLSPHDRRRVLDAGRLVHLPAGWSMTRTGEPAGEAWLVLEGRLEVVDGDHHVADIGPGELAGEIGLVNLRLRNARVTTTGPVLVLAFPRAEFQRLRHDVPAFDAVAVRSTSRREASGN